MRNILKLLWRYSLALAVLAAAAVLFALTATENSNPSQDGNEATEVVARVNGEDVTSSELHRAEVDLLELSRLQRQTGDNNPDPEELSRLAMQSLIHRQLMLQEAAERQLSLSDDELDKAIGELRRRFEDLGGFGRWMEKRGLDDKLLVDTIRDDVLTSRVTEALVVEIVVTEEQIEEYYEAYKEDLVIGEEVRLQIISVESMEAGDAVLTALSDGASFDSVAKQVSRGQRAALGGDTGWLDKATLPPQLQQIVGKLKKGEAYGPIEKDPDEFLIVALAGQRLVRAQNLDEARPEIERRLLATSRQGAVQAWLAEKEQEADIEVFLQPG